MASVPSRNRSGRRTFIQYLADNNPFYLLSAASMLLACLLLSNTTTWSPIAARKLVMLIVTLNLYELLLVGLGLYLIVRRNHVRDGVMLLVLEAVFLADVGFLNSELYTESFRTGLVVNAVLLALGMVKIALIFRALKMPLASPAFALTGVMMTALLGHAAVFRQIGDGHNGRLPDLVMYLAWWGFAGLMIAYALVMRWSPPDAFRGTRPGVMKSGIGHVMVSLMLASLAAHLGTSHWIYSCPFQAPDVAPVLIGLAFLLAGVKPRETTNAGAIFGYRDARILCTLLPIAAVLVSLNPSNRLATALAAYAVSPLKMSLASAYFTLVYAFALRHFARYAVLGIVGAAAYLFGPTWATLQHWGERVYQLLASGFDRALPRTQAAWGAIALAGAFVLLAVGAAINLFRPKGDDADDAPGPPPAAGPPVIPMTDVV